MQSDVLVVAFTGTRRGMQDSQQARLRERLEALRDAHGQVWLCHGDCVGADAQAHAIAKALGYKVAVFPPDRDGQRAFVTDYDWIATPKPFLVRDDLMVKHAHTVFGTPHQFKEVYRGSGTWYTIRRACAARKAGEIIYPDGSTEPLANRYRAANR